MSSINLTHHFLIAMPNMADPYFSRTLTYICEHNDQGALGLVVNRPIDMTLQALFERLSLTLRDGYLAAAPIYLDRKSTRLNQSPMYLVCRLLLEKKNKKINIYS